MAVAASAQTIGRIRLIANIPFEFSVGNKTLPAGEYTIRQFNPSSDHSVLQFRSKDGSVGAIVQTTSVIARAPENARLIFRRYDNHYFFAEAWVDGQNTGLQASKSRAERFAEREMAGIKAKTESVALRRK
jgi:hypothetical protein